jgi:putative glutamine amidotransferase
VSTRPLIGLSTYVQPVRFGPGEMLAAALPMAYVKAVHGAGGRAVLITPDDPGADVLERLDGLVLTGGSDVDPARYGETPHAATIVRPERDEAEVLLLRAALAADLPVLGVCRGLQVMAVAYGGRLSQHLPESLGTHLHRPADAPGYSGHTVGTVAGTLCRKILGEELVVNCSHHQGIADPGRLTVGGWSTDDDLVEAAEDSDHAFVLGVQWHPEDSGDHRLFAALVQAARDRREAST